MNLDQVVSARIHPAIGVARIGNSPEGYFIGPEVPHPAGPPEGGYRDAEGRLKRQAAQFRIYGYNAAGEVVAELTADNACLRWSVHVANKKGAWYDFDVALDIPDASETQSPRRNSSISGEARKQLIIDPGPRSISGRNQAAAPFDTGRFFGQQVYLGELRTDGEGRLLFLGGHGDSGTPFPNNTLTTFANNAGWHDDTADGPVSATVSIGDRTIPVDPAWVIVGPPNYAPDIVTVQTMYDVMVDAVSGSLMPRPAKPSFTQNILPLFRQFCETQWVNYGFFAQFGWRAPNEFLRPDYLGKLAAAGTEYQELRRQIFYMMRSPNATTPQPLLWPAIYGDAFGNFDGSPRTGFSITATNYKLLQQWMNGDFDSDYDPSAHPPAALDEVPLQDQPATLDKAALHFCMGGPFHPGCEMTWPMRRASMYRAPFRLRIRPADLPEPDYGEYLTQTLVLSDDGPLSSSGPGDITKWMAIPWQADTASCRSGYPTPDFPADEYIPTFWPSRVPNDVLTDADYRVVMDSERPMAERVAAFQRRVRWLRSLNMSAPYVHQITKMLDVFGQLGIVLKQPGPGDAGFPPDIFVESLPEPARTFAAPAATADAPAARVSDEFHAARFGAARRGRR